MLERFANADSDQLLLVFLAVLPVLLLLSPAIWRFATFQFSKVDIMAPLFVAVGTVFIGTTLRTFFLVFDPEAADKMVQVLGPYQPEDVLLNGLIVINIGVVAWFLGYSLPTGFRAAYAVPQPIPVNLKRVIAYAAAISIFLNLYYLYQISFFQNISELGLSAKRFFIVGDDDVAITDRTANRTTYQYLKLGADTLFACVVIYACYLYYRTDENGYEGAAKQDSKRKFKNIIALWLLVFLAAIVPFVASVRGELVYLVIAIILARHYLLRPFKLRYLVLTFCAAMLLLTQLEVLRQQSKIGDRAIPFSMSRVVHTLVYTAHFVGVGKTSAIVEHFPDNENYHYGTSYLTVFIAPIPRVLWPEKPVVRIGKYVGGEVLKRNSNTGVVPGVIGEAYLNFGTGGVAVILFLFGYFCKIAYRWMQAHKHTRPLVVGCYAILWIFMMDMFTSDFTGSVVRLLRVLLPFWIILFFLSNRSVFSERPKNGINQHAHSQ